MTEFYVHNSLNVTKAVKFNISLRYFVIKEEAGEHCWTLEIGTTHSGINGEEYLSTKVHRISVEDLDEVIENAVSELCSRIDWSPYVQDKESPYISDFFPENGDSDVSIGAMIYFKINEYLPAAGIDLSDLKVILNNSMVDFNITDEMIITGDPYMFSLAWSPKLRVYSEYGEVL